MDKDTYTEKLIDYLKEFTTEARWNTIQDVLSKRTTHLTVVLEDLHKSHNANAVLRSCDGFGIQDIHIIENRTAFDTESTVSIGAHQWLTLHKYNDESQDNVETCFKNLKGEGYTIIATTPHERDVNLHQLSVSDKTALVFGSEREGISDRVRDLADGFVKIPMYGFSESFNISVSAAICLYDLTNKLRSGNINWQLSEDYKTELALLWLKNTIKASDKLVQKFEEEFRTST
ncbi:MAG: TrmH family RNA methyltransferase [Balneola sp.]|nr:MAG: TrmH family RNA methyltransferase [Balneola sp.]